MKTIVKITNAICVAAMVLAFLAAFDAVQSSESMSQLLTSIVTPSAMFVCAFVGRKVLNETAKDL